MNNYTLHSTGPNWFHFRPFHPTQHRESIDNSFTITYIPDGTVLMSGDLGCLAWRRRNFPVKPDYGFPYPGTNIEYFVEKILCAENTQSIVAWTHAQAMIDIVAAAIESTDDINQRVLWEAYDAQTLHESGIYGYHQMLEVFADGDHTIDPDEYSAFGMDYTDVFLNWFSILQSVSEMILSYVTDHTGF